MIWQFTSIWNGYLFVVFLSSKDNGRVILGLANLAGSQIVPYPEGVCRRPHRHCADLAGLLHPWPLVRRRTDGRSRQELTGTVPGGARHRPCMRSAPTTGVLYINSIPTVDSTPPEWEGAILRVWSQTSLFVASSQTRPIFVNSAWIIAV